MRLNLVRACLCEQIWQLLPVLVWSMMLKVSPIVHVVHLAIGWVFPRLKKYSAVLQSILFFKLAYCPLLLLDKVFVLCCAFHISFLKGSLVRSPSCVCWCHYIVQPRWKVIHLQGEVTHTVHEICLLRVRSLLPDQFSCAFLRQNPLEVHL